MADPVPIHCPFDGYATPILQKGGHANDGTPTFSVICPVCRNHTPELPSMQAAVDAWGLRGAQLITRLGDQTIEASVQTVAGTLTATNITVAAPAYLQSLSIYISAAAGTLRMGIYDATGVGGGPGHLIAECAGDPVTPVVGWNTVAFAAPVLLAAGNYWIAYNNSDATLETRYTATGTNNTAYIVSAYAALPTTFPGGFSTTALLTWSFYASLTSV